MAGVTRPRVVIIGAGFGGLWAARAFTGAPVHPRVRLIIPMPGNESLNYRG